jgi:tetratricopeptide (TPR) repeat protein
MRKTFKYVVFAVSMSSVAMLLIFLSSCNKISSMTTNELLIQATESALEGKWSKTLKFAKVAVEREPANTPAFILLAMAYENVGKSELAMEAARKAVKLERDNFMAQYTLGRLYAIDQNKLQDAIEPLLRALTLRPNDPDTLVLLADCSQKLNLPKTTDYYSQLVALSAFNKRYEPWNQLGIYYAEKNSLRNAAICFNQAYTLAPDNHMVLLNFGIFFDKYIRKPDRALNFYKRYLEVTANNPEMDQKKQEIKARIKDLSDK